MTLRLELFHMTFCSELFHMTPCPELFHKYHGQFFVLNEFKDTVEPLLHFLHMVVEGLLYVMINHFKQAQGPTPLLSLLTN